MVRHLPGDQVTWDLFQKEFQKKYIGELYIEEKKQEFLVLKQGNMSVLDYERESSRLSRYALEYVPTEADSCKRFLWGLRDEIKIQLVSLKITELVDLVERAKMIEQVLAWIKNQKLVNQLGNVWELLVLIHYRRDSKNQEVTGNLVLVQTKVVEAEVTR